MPSEIGEELGFTCKYDKFDRVLAKRVVVKGGFRNLFLEVYISSCFFFLQLKGSQRRDLEQVIKVFFGCLSGVLIVLSSSKG